MGIFSFLKKISKEQEGPYDDATNLVYNLLFCDDLNLLEENTAKPYVYPFDILFSETSSVVELQKVIDNASESRIKLFGYNKQIKNGYQPKNKDLLGVVVEVAFDKGLDVLASFSDGNARYINQTGKILIWETKDANAEKLREALFLKSQEVVNKIGPWDKPRRPHPSKGNTRITFLVSDGLYFGEATTSVFFAEPLASPALAAAAELLKYLTENSINTD